MTSRFLLQRIYLPPTPKWPQPGRRTWVPAHKGLDPKTPLRRGLPKPPLRKGLEVQGGDPVDGPGIHRTSRPKVPLFQSWAWEPIGQRGAIKVLASFCWFLVDQEKISWDPPGVENPIKKKNQDFRLVKSHNRWWNFNLFLVFTAKFGGKGFSIWLAHIFSNGLVRFNHQAAIIGLWGKSRILRTYWIILIRNI